MFKKLLAFEAFYQFKQRALPIFALLFLALGVAVGGQGFAPKGINFNSIYQVYTHAGIFTLGSVFIIMFFAISAMLRDKQHQMEGLVYSTSIKKSTYFWSRFLGTFAFSVLAFSPFMLGYIFGNFFGGLAPERISDFHLWTYLQPWLYIVLPNLFICSAIVFSVCSLTKNSTATYVSAVLIYTLYFVCSLVLNSPILAKTVPASPESMAIAAIFDPFGLAAFFEQTQYWTPFQKNTQLISFSGLFLVNRLVWVGLGLGLLLLTYRLFSFRKQNQKVKKEIKISNENASTISYIPLKTLHNFKAQKSAFIALLKLELKSIFKSLPFIAVLLMWLFIIFSELYSTVITGVEYGVSMYPFTHYLIELIVGPLSIFSLILIAFYSADIVWKERSLRFNLIIDATPVKNSVFFLSKYIALLLLPLLLITVGIILYILFQISVGYYNFEFSIYASLYYFHGLQLMIFCSIALFINTLVKNKYMGMGIFGMLAIISMKPDLLGLEHPLTSIGFMPRVSFSEMSGFYNGAALYKHLSIYWTALAGILILFSFKIWDRGIVSSFINKIKQLPLNWSIAQKISLSVLTVAFFTFGGVIFYNVNIDEEYVTFQETLNFKESYERKFKKYEVLGRPTRTSIRTEVSIFPSERTYTVKASQILKNSGDQPLSQVFISERVALKQVSIKNAKRIMHDPYYGIHLFQFEVPLKPNDSVTFTYELTKTLKGFDDDMSIAENGTYINRSSNFEPILGYRSGIEITNKPEREKRGLPELIKEETLDPHLGLDKFKFEKVNFETIISTDQDQTAISSGTLIKEWTEDNRNYFHYKSDKKIMPGAGYFSAQYEVKKSDYEGIAIEQYYHKGHQINVERIEEATKQTLAYCQQNFGEYEFDHVRIAEVSSYWPFGGFAHPGVISMTEDKLYLYDVSNENTFDVVAKRTIHEVAHQWWGHTLSAKPAPGGSLLIEGLAKYTEAVVMESIYGKRAVYTLTEDARYKYFYGRSMEGDVEPPVYKILGHSYISYGKALNVMLALRDLIGEEKLNSVLKDITEANRYKNNLEVTTIDFLNELYKVTSEDKHHLIDDWFKKVITYDLKVDEASYKKLADGTFEVSATINSNRFETLDSGETKEIDLNEPVKIGIFTTHPSKVKDDITVLYYESNAIKKGVQEFKIIVKEKPSFIAIDPYGTRSDENLVDNIREL